MPTEFRGYLVLGYEILKWAAGTPSPTIFHPVESDVAEEKACVLLMHNRTRDSEGYRGMRLQVTGHQGYLGTVMVPISQAVWYDVMGLDSGFFAAYVRGVGPQDRPAIRANLRDVAYEQLGGFEDVIHLVALSIDPLDALAWQITYDINHHASARLARHRATLS